MQVDDLRDILLHSPTHGATVSALLRVFVPLGFFAVIAGCSQAPDEGHASNEGAAKQVKQDYEMQERCGKRSAEKFKKEWSDISSTSGTSTTADYTNHYNKKLNKCFFLVRTTSFGKGTYTGASLIDVNENKEYASYDDISGTKDVRTIMMRCEVQGRTCGSKGEWDLLVEPFMME